MSYATPDDMIKRKSTKTLGQLCSDSGTAISEVGLATDDNLQAALDSASGAIDAALMQGGRYTSSQLTALTGNSLAYLVHICCEIAMAYLYARKPTYQVEDYKAALDLHDLYLERLRKGENVFNIAVVIDAGTPSSAQPSVSSIQEKQFLRDRVRNYYPHRISTS